MDLELRKYTTASFGFFALVESFCRQNCFICIVWKLLETELHHLYCLKIIEDMTPGGSVCNAVGGMPLVVMQEDCLSGLNLTCHKRSIILTRRRIL